jgi:hypothetical protein
MVTFFHVIPPFYELTVNGDASINMDVKAAEKVFSLVKFAAEAV